MACGSPPPPLTENPVGIAHHRNPVEPCQRRLHSTKQVPIIGTHTAGSGDDRRRLCMSGLPLLFKKEGLIERHQVEGIDPWLLSRKALAEYIAEGRCQRPFHFGPSAAKPLASAQAQPGVAACAAVRQRQCWRGFATSAQGIPEEAPVLARNLRSLVAQEGCAAARARLPTTKTPSRGDRPWKRFTR